jgi:hypothetical protein
MIIQRTDFSSEFLKGELRLMRKLMTLMLGLSLALGAVSVSFGQDTPPKKEGKKKGKKKKEDTAPKSR